MRVMSAMTYRFLRTNVPKNSIWAKKQLVIPVRLG